MSTEEVKICKCDYCGNILGKDDDYIHIYANDDRWLHFDRVKSGYIVNGVTNYELDFCNCEHMVAYIQRELMVKS